MSIHLPLLAGCALYYAGMTALCLGMGRHHKEVWASKSPARQFVLRSSGRLLVALALLRCVKLRAGRSV